MRHAAETEGIDESELLVFQDVASSFADTRQGLNRLLDAIIAGQVSRLYVLQQDRLARLGCVLGIVNHFAEQHGVEIVYLDDETDKDEAVSDWQDLMVIIANTIQHANAKMAGLKSAKVVTKRMDQVTVDAAKKLRAEGLGLDEIADKLNADGHVLTRQDGTTHKITRHALRKWAFATPKGKLHLATPKDCGFANWWNEHMEACSGNRIEASRVYDSFRRYRKNRGHKVAGTNSRLGHEVPNVQRERRLDRWWFVGWKIKGENVDAAKLDVVDSFAAFVERFIVKSDGGTLETRQVWSAYTEFCRANNLKMESRKHAGLYLRTIASSATLTSSKTFSFGGLRFVG
jgi:DNA invertase Pin-like site-specific DNA recombinase